MAHLQGEMNAAEQGPAQRPGETDGEEEKDKVKPHQRLLRSKGFIPSVVVVVLIVFVLLSPRMAGSPPRLDSLTPARAKPGDVMILSGHNFGNSQEGSEVRISGISPTSQDYTEWTDTRISLRIPEEAGSGIVYVLTKSGRSSGLLFISQNDIPQPASGSSRRATPTSSPPVMRPSSRPPHGSGTPSPSMASISGWRRETRTCTSPGPASRQRQGEASTLPASCLPATTTLITSHGRTARSGSGCRRVRRRETSW